MSDTQQGPGWWLASDGKWYPPSSVPGYASPSAPQPNQQLGLIVPVHVSGWAVAAGYLGLLTFVFCTVSGPFPVWAGRKGLKQIEADPTLNGRFRAWVGIVLGGLGRLVLVLVVIVSAVAYLAE